LSADETVLSVTSDGETESWEIEDLKKDTFQANYKVTQEGVTYTFTVTFKKN